MLVSRGCVGITLSGLNKKSITERRIGRLRLIPEIVVEGKPIVLEEDHIKGLLATCGKGSHKWIVDILLEIPEAVNGYL